MLCGTPVVAFNKGSMPELIYDGKTGFLVNNIDEAKNILNYVKKIDPKHCRKWAEDNFSQERMVNNYIKIYNRILKRQIKTY